MRKLVDAHSHFFGPVFFETLAAAADPSHDPTPGLERLRARGIEISRTSAVLHARRWLAEMDRAGVEQMITFASIPEEATSVAEGAGSTSGRLVPFCIVNPAAPGIEARVHHLGEGLGMRGLVLFPAMHRYDLSDSALEPFYRAVETLGLPLVVHLGILSVPVRDALGLPSDFDPSCSLPSRLRGAALRHPTLRFLVPHFGGVTFRETLALAQECPNVALDTSSSNGWLRQYEGLTLAEVMGRALETVGPRRLHFGTDSSVFPRGWREEIYAEQRVLLEALGVPETEQDAIFRGNTLDLLAGRS